MEETITIVLVIIGALIGAGFASGQEIYTFFYSHGVVGLIGICITFCMMEILIYKSLKIINNHNNIYKKCQLNRQLGISTMSNIKMVQSW